MLPFISEIKECPKCGSDFGYEIYIRVRGKIVEFYSFNGEAISNESMFDNLSYGKQNKYVKCINCKETIARIE